MEPAITVRNCRPKDSGDSAAYESLKKGAVFAHLLSKPDYDADENLFIAEADGSIVGFINVLPELRIGRAVLDYAVSPLYELQAVLKELMKRALKRAKRLGATVAHAGVPSIETEPAEVLSNLGFKPVRRFCDMQLNVSGIDLEGADRLDRAYRYFKDGDEEGLSDIQNRCFAGAWGYNPNTVAHTTWKLKVRNNIPEDVVLALEKEEVLG